MTKEYYDHTQPVKTASVPSEIRVEYSRINPDNGMYSVFASDNYRYGAVLLYTPTACCNSLVLVYRCIV